MKNYKNSQNVRSPGKTITTRTRERASCIVRSCAYQLIVNDTVSRARGRFAARLMSFPCRSPYHGDPHLGIDSRESFPSDSELVPLHRFPTTILYTRMKMNIGSDWTIAG